MNLQLIGIDAHAFTLLLSRVRADGSREGKPILVEGFDRCDDADDEEVDAEKWAYIELSDGLHFQWTRTSPEVDEFLAKHGQAIVDVYLDMQRIGR